MAASLRSTGGGYLVAMGLLRRHLTYANVAASLALFLALGGAAYAATQLPKQLGRHGSDLKRKR